MGMREQIEQLIERIGGRQRALFLAVGLGAALVIFGLSRWATAPTYVPAFTGLPLESVGLVTDKLGEAGIPFRLDGGGTTVLVPATDMARARVALAREGGMPAAGRPGMEIFDQPSWGMTDFTQRINYRRALEGELERTIGEMAGVEKAKVHLALHEGSTFRAPDRPAEASVVLRLRSGQSPGRDVVQGIAHLVSSSVDGIKSDDVTVLDDGGRLLSIPNEPGSIAALTHRQLSMQREVEGYLERKAQEMVSDLVGAGNSRVQVAAALTFDRVERTVQRVDPEGQALASEQRAEIIPGAEGGAGSSNVSATYENSRSVESFSGAPGTVKRLTVAVLVNDRKEGAAAQPRSAAELSNIEALVAGAVGLDPTRGDAISVVSMPFSAAEGLMDTEEPLDVMGALQMNQRLIITLVGLLFAFVIALKVIRTMRPEPAVQEQQVAALAAPESEAIAELPRIDETPTVFVLPEEPAIPALNPTVRDKVAADVNDRTEQALQLVRTWLKEG